MTIKWTRQSALLTLMAAMLLLAFYYFGNQYYVEPIANEVNTVQAEVKSQQMLMEQYPPSEELLAEYIANSESTKSFLPNGDQINLALIRLEELAAAADVNLHSVSRITYEQPVEDVPQQFMKNSYSVQVSAASPANFRSLISALIQEERVWNVTSLSYSKSGEGSYTGNFNVTIYYFLGVDFAAEEIAADVPAK
ncbi:MAG: hypothetical protein PHR78_04235 [Eubacteriales bacterium]|nr:hypothetical protein [Eubacteriales bacterium]MDD4541357.1 hypothetical protein [Eubacteriales bacterium]